MKRKWTKRNLRKTRTSWSGGYVPLPLSPGQQRHLLGSYKLEACSGYSWSVHGDGDDGGGGGDESC